MVKPAEAPADAQSLKKTLHERIEQLSGEKLSLVNRVLLQLEAEDLANSLDDAFDEDRKAGKLAPDRIQKILSEIRAEHRYS
jgi:hypothetical protein